MRFYSRILRGAPIACLVILGAQCRVANSSDVLQLTALLQVFSASTCSPRILGGNKIGCDLNLTGIVSTVAGPAPGSAVTGDTDATGNTARFSSPSHLATDGTALYVPESGNNKVRRITLAGLVVTTPYGPPQGTTTAGDMDATGNTARFTNPVGALWMADYGGIQPAVLTGDINNNKVRLINITTGAVSTVAGPAPGATTSGDTDAVGNASRFNQPYGLTEDGTSVFIADLSNNKIRKLTPGSGSVITPYGPSQGTTVSGDTDATGNAARFNGPISITTDGSNLYVSDSGNNKIRKIVISTGVVTTIAGPPQGNTTAGDTEGTGSAARFNNPRGIATDGTNLYVADFGNNKIKKIVIATGAVSIVAGPPQGTTTSGDADGSGPNARFNQPSYIVVEADGIYVTEAAKIRKIR